jgi:ribosomal protein S18 acetylase RimI-like enzyme
MAVVIRAYRPDDKAAILQLTIEAFEPVSIDRNIEKRFGLVGEHDWRWRKSRQVNRELEENPQGCFVAEDDGQVVGYITTLADIEAGMGWIANLAVAHDHRGAGIGRSLILQALRYFKQLGLTHARIETLEQNPIGQRLYPQCGFVEVARQIHYCRSLDDIPTEEAG